MKTILIIEDDPNIHEMLKVLLLQNDYEVKSAYSGTEALLVHNQTVDLILLDLMLPGKSGEDIIRELKRIHPVPIIVTSALSDLEKKLNLFELGADDYVTKPFSNDELLARMKVHLRNSQQEEQDMIQVDDLLLNKKTHQVICNHIHLNLSRIEFAILELLMEYKNQVINKNDLLQRIWKNNSAEDSLNNCICSLRKKLSKDALLKIENLKGIGFALRIFEAE